MSKRTETMTPAEFYEAAKQAHRFSGRKTYPSLQDALEGAAATGLWCLQCDSTLGKLMIRADAKRHNEKSFKVYLGVYTVGGKDAVCTKNLKAALGL